MTGRKKLNPSMGLSLPSSFLLVVFLAALIDRKQYFAVVLPAVPLPKSVVEAFVVPKASLQNRIPSKLLSTSASAAYLESISYKPPTLEDGLLGATAKYLDAISSVSAQWNSNGYHANSVFSSSTDQAFSEVAAVAASPTYGGAPFSEEQLVNEVVQRVTQEFSSALEAFGGQTYESFFDSMSTTLLSQSRPQYLWEMDDFDLEVPVKPAAKAAKSVQEAASNSQPNANPEETMQELSNKLEGSFRSFKESLSSSTHSVKSTFTDSLRRETTQPNAAVTTAKQQENIQQMRQRLDEGQLNPEVLSQSAKEAASTMAEAANKALVESNIALPTEAETAVNSLGGSISDTASGAVKSLSETASNANSAITETQQGIQKSFGSFVTNTNQGIGKALSSFAESTSAATHSISESASAASSAVTSAIGGGASSIAKSASAASSAVSNAIGGGASSLAESASAASSAVTSAIEGGASSVAGSANTASSAVNSAIGGGASSIAGTANTASSAAATAITGATSETAKVIAVTASSAKQSMGAAGMAVKGAVVTAKPGTAATAGKVSAVALSANQGFGMPGNAYAGGGDVSGLVEMVLATVASLPRAVVDAAMIETNNPNAMDDLMEGISSGLYNDILIPLSKPLRESTAAAASSTPLEQAQAVLQTSQRVMALVVSIPRAVVEGVTGQPITEFQAQIAEADINALAQQLSGFASTVATLLISFLKVVAQAISYLVAAATSQGVGGGAVAERVIQQQDTIAKLVSFLLEDLLPAIIDGLAMVLQQFVLLLLEGGSAIVAAL